MPLEGTPRFPVTETDPGDLDASIAGKGGGGGGGGGGNVEARFEEVMMKDKQ